MTMVRALLLGATLFAIASARGDEGVDPRRSFHYRPAGARFGDPMPIWRDGTYHVFYLKKTPPSEDLVWSHISSRNLLDWKEHPDLPMRGCTGCFIVKDGVAYAFTGNSRADRWISRDPDMETWQRDPAVSVQLDPRWYDLKAGWRDPSVVWMPEHDRYWMVATARTAAGAGRHSKNGCVALATSPDLATWEIHSPLWQPDSCMWPECPDLFPLGDRWALFYLHEGTQLRLSESPRGPWPRPAIETLNKGLAAGRTLFDGRRRLLFGWLYDQGWGGDMLLPRELSIQADGSVASRCAEEIVAACRKGPDATRGVGTTVFQPLSGSWQKAHGSAKADVPTGQSAMAVWTDAPENLYLETTIRIGDGARACLVLRGEGETIEEAAVAVLADPAQDTIALCGWNPWHSCVPLGAETTARHVFREGGEVFVQVYLSGGILEVFFDERRSLAARVGRGPGSLGLFAREGPVSWENLLVREVK